MPANSRWDLIRRLRVKIVEYLNIIFQIYFVLVYCNLKKKIPLPGRLRFILSKVEFGVAFLSLSRQLLAR